MANAILPPGVAAVARDGQGDVGQLYAEELEAVVSAVPSRRAEFAAGRDAARDALLQLGQAPVPLPVAEWRGPSWPAGFTGSISHCRGAVIAIAARLDTGLGHLGIDIEEADGLDPELWDSVCTPFEMAWLRGLADARGWAKVIFSIKEAVYKAQYPITRTMLDFQDVELGPLEASDSFEAHIDMVKLKVTGRFRVAGRFVLAFASARRPDL